jgi:hypothetical protein
MSDFEYRVVWRREHDGTRRRKLYQTFAGAQGFADFLEVGPVDDLSIHSTLGGTLEKLGDPVDIRIERRLVGEWSEAKP